MKKSSNVVMLIFTTFLICYGYNSFAQYNTGYIINNNGDTLNCNIFLPNYLNGDPNYSTLTKLIITSTESGSVKYKPEDIKIAEVKLPTNEKIRFVSIPEDKKHFFQENEIGRLSYFTLHNTTSGFPIPILKKDGELIYLNVANKKKRVEKLIADFPKLREDWNNGEYDFTQLQKVIKIYNQHFRQVK